MYAAYLTVLVSLAALLCVVHTISPRRGSSLLSTAANEMRFFFFSLLLLVVPGVRAHRDGRFCGVLAACLSLTVCRCVCLVHVAALLRHLFWRTPLLLPLSSALCLLRHRRPGLCGATRFNFHPQQTQLQLAVSKHAINRRAIFFGSSRHTSFVLVAESQDARGPVLWGKSRPFCAHQSFFGRNVW